MVPLLVMLFTALGTANAGKIIGKIVNVSEAPVEGVKISIVELRVSTVTTSSGSFTFDSIPQGIYTITAKHKKFQTSEQAVQINNNNTQQITIALLAKTTQIDQVVIRNERPVGRGKEIEEAEVSLGKSKLVIQPQAEKKTSAPLTRGLEAPVNIVEYDGAGLQLGIGGRGLNPQRTAHFNTRQNGYEISADALGYPETYYAPPSEAIKEIKILRGAASLQYGPQFGGMINFKLQDGPQKPTDQIEFISNTKYGSFNQLHTFNSLATQKGKLKTYSFYHLKTGEGWRNNSAYTSHTGYTGLTYQANSHLKLKFEFTHHQYTAQQAGGLTDRQFEEDPRASFRARNYFDVDWNIANITINYKFNSDQWINSKTFFIDASRNTLGNLENPSRADLGDNRILITGDFSNFGNETRYIKRYKIAKKHNAALIAGVRFYRGDAITAQGTGTNGSDADFALSNDPEISRYQFPSTNVSAFLENTFFINRSLYITPGYRYEHVNTSAAGYFKSYAINLANDTLQVNVENKKNSTVRDIHLAGLGITYNAKKYGKIIGNVSQNFRSVNFSDINVVVPNFRVDENIQDERGFTADLNYTKNWKQSAYLSVTGYYVYYANRIGDIWEVDEENFDIYQLRTNVSASRTIGAEITAFWRFNKKLGLRDSLHNLNVLANVTVNNAKYIGSGTNVEGNWVEMVPAFTAKTSLNYEYKNWLVTGLLNFQTQQFSEATNATESATGLFGTIPSFYVIDTKASYKFKKFTFQLSVNNITNVNYFTQRAIGYPGPGIIPSEGRTFWGGLILNL